MLLLIMVAGAFYVTIQALLAYACKLPSETKSKLNVSLPALSVIIAARNEEKNLERHLPIVLQQAYEKYEVLVVLDRCEDRSRNMVESLQKEHAHLRFIEIDELPDGWAGKKWAIEQGIKESTFSHLVFTDADCTPDPNWLNSIACHFSSGSELVLGLGHYHKEPGLLNTFIQFETFYTCFQYIGFAKLGQPYMGVGRNIAYTKKFFTENHGFEEIKERLSGDDDLLVNKHANSHKTSCMLEESSKTLSVPKKTWKSWLKQKLRHLGAAPAYTLRSKILLGIFHGSHFLFYVGILFFLLLNQTIWLFWASYIGRIMISWIIFLGIKKKLQFESQLYLFPVLDLLYFIYNLSLVPIGYIQKRMAWS